MSRAGCCAVVLAGLWLLGSCGPKVANDPPPQTPASVTAAPDGGFPPVPLERKGVIVPSDVPLQPPAQDPAQRPGPLGAPASPGGN